MDPNQPNLDEIIALQEATPKNINLKFAGAVIPGFQSDLQKVIAGISGSGRKIPSLEGIVVYAMRCLAANPNSDVPHSSDTLAQANEVASRMLKTQGGAGSPTGAKRGPKKKKG